MKKKALNKGELNTLERLIDLTPVCLLLADIANICQGKAHHLDVAWEDKEEAAKWDRAALIIKEAAEEVMNIDREL